MNHDTSSLALAALLAATGSASAQEKLTFALNWFPVGDHAAYWVALEKGYYKAKGLDVTLENSKGSGDTIAKVDTGRADAGLADAAVLIASKARGTTVKTIGMVFDKTPLNIFSLKSKPLAKPKDLEGTTLGAPPGDASARCSRPSPRPTASTPARSPGSTSSRPPRSPPSPRSAWTASATTRPACRSTRRPRGKGNVVMMPWADFGFDLYSMSIMASEKTMKEKPKQLKAFLEASYMGWRDVMADPKAAMAIFKKRVPEIDVDALTENMMMGLELMKTEQLRRERHRLDRRQEDVRLGRPGEHLHGPAQEGRLQGRLHQGVLHQGRDAEASN